MTGITAPPRLFPRSEPGAPLLASATWIAPDEPHTAEAGRRPAYILRTEFGPASAAHAVAHVTAHGIVELFLNGVRVGDEELTPGFSAYRKRLFVHTFEVGALLRADATNVITALLSDGWFRGRHGFERRADGFGERTALLASITDADGVTLVTTDRTWRSRPSHLVHADLMDGQTTDQTLHDPSWYSPGCSDDGWGDVVPLSDLSASDLTRLIPAEGPPIRRREVLTPAALTHPRPGTVVLDLGRNINGWLRVPDVGPAGTHLMITHGEALDAHGLVDTDHLRAFVFHSGERLPAGQVDEVVSAGRREPFEPRHTTHGFRYAQVDGVPDGLDLSGVRGVVVGSDLAATGSFSCSDARLEALHEVVAASLWANTCGVPTDCPQRERSGFTGDWQVFVATAALLADVEEFSRRWLRDLAADQWADGRVPTIVPNPGGDRPSGVAFEDASAGSAGWGDAAALVPWELWRAYGDPDAVAEQLPAAVRWVDYAAACAAGARHPDRAAARPVPADHERFLWDTGFHFGEWLEPDAPPAPDPSRDHGIVATAFLHRSASVAARLAAVAGEHDTAARMAAIAAGARRAWQAEYLRADGSLTEERQAHYVRALAFGLVPDTLSQATADRLAALVHAADDRLTTGFLATGDLLGVLADHGHADLAHRLLTRTGHPSWLGMIEAGATTMWEWWDGVRPDGSVRGSLNHYSKGAVASYLYTHIAGVRLPADPGRGEAGYRRITIDPHPDDLTHASASLLTPQGPLHVAWRRADDILVLDADLPDATTATVRLPDGSERTVTGGQHTFTAEEAHR